MFVLLVFFIMTFALSTFVMILASFLAKKSILDREKSSPYECGFDPKSSARLPFSLQFFLIAVIFLIFDVEITLLLPLSYSLTYSSMFYWLVVSVLFLIVLLFGLYYEWSQGALEWSY